MATYVCTTCFSTVTSPLVTIRIHHVLFNSQKPTGYYPYAQPAFQQSNDPYSTHSVYSCALHDSPPPPPPKLPYKNNELYLLMETQRVFCEKLGF